MTISVREARYDDIDWLIGQLHEFDKFAAFKRPLFRDDAYGRIALKNLIKEHVCLVAEYDDSGTRMGFIAGLKSAHLFDPELRVLTQLFWWVALDYRHTRAGLLLLSAFEQHGREHFDWVAFSLEHHSPVRAEALTKRGFVMKEQAYLLEV